jgi:mRNA-decapping enzyme 1B
MLDDGVTPVMPEPLTRNQLLQAFNYLLKNDPEFVNKLHEEYVKSFSEMVT